MTPNHDHGPGRPDSSLGVLSCGDPDGHDPPTREFSSEYPPDPGFEVLTPDGLVSADTLPVPEAERYEPLDRIAEGGMGVVYRARDRLLGRVVALKVLREDLASHPRIVARFHREARITSQLDHPGVIAVHDTGTLGDGRPFIVMKYVRGRPLNDILAARQGPAHALPHWLAAFTQLCQVMVYTHARGVIHRDLKPANVLICGFRQVYLLDWGLARLLAEPPDDEPGRVLSPVGLPEGGDTADGVLLGTPAFVAPEQANGRPVDERTDVFGLGAILAVILTNHPPYVGATQAEVLAQARAGEILAAHYRLNACGADPRLLGLAKACLSADPADRPRKVTEVLAALNAVRTA